MEASMRYSIIASARSSLSGHGMKRKSSNVRTCAKAGDEEESSGNALGDAGNAVLNGLVAVVPDSVPRPLAKGGVVLVGALSIYVIFTTLLNAAFTLLLVGGIGVTAFTITRSNASDEDESGDDGDMSLDEARKIMDKYK
ncbi:hypothetical protein CYMTET_27140 [Cymbomonas tetramitiformis]|uniref:Uncharacterized protein n=1 Tax=Cymbomonas tetramitiformis TaxID=36881 RepID=A0AAE0KXG6_9CHLO|nr:hypothetical protein CYMTET_27140 [Cymbomonas tetramitiformis]